MAMSDEPRRRLEREGALFFGAVGAGLSHELSNVFNIINELSGLQQDILATVAQESTTGLARVVDLATRIKNQIIRGEEINRCLHHLSHTVDKEETTFDLGEKLALLGSLVARAARLAEVELSVRPPESPIAHLGDPFALLLALHGCVMTAIKAAASERRIDIWSEPEADGVRVIVRSADPMPQLESDTPAAAAIDAGCAALSVVPRLEPASEGGHRIVLALNGVSTETASGDVNDSESED
jgi:hypothetical protein